MKYFMVLLSVLFLGKSYAESVVIANKGDQSMSFVSVDTKETFKVPVGYLPHEVAVNKTHAFVSNYGHQHVRSFSLANRPGNTLSVIRLSDGKKEGDIDLGESQCAPHGVEASKDGSFVFVTCEGRQEIAVVDAKRMKVKKFLRTNQPGSHMLTVGPKGRLYVTNFWIGTVSVIDIESGELLKQIFTGRSTEGIGISPDGRSLFVTVVETDELVRISLDSLKIEHRVSLPEGLSPIRVVVSNDNSTLVVNHAAKNSVGLYDARSLKLKREVPVGRQPIGLAYSRATNRAYVANMNDGSISVVDVLNMNLIETIKLGLRLPDGLAVVH